MPNSEYNSRQEGRATAINPGEIRVAVLAHAEAKVLDEPLTLADVAERSSNDSLKAATAKMREHYARSGKSNPHYIKAKKFDTLVIMPAIDAPKGTPRTGISIADCHTGLYGFDIDDEREHLDLPVIRELLVATPGAVMVGTSCAGNALWAVLASPYASSNGDYNAKRDAIIQQHFPALVRLHNEGSRDALKLRFVCDDPDVWLADSVTPLAVTVQESRWKPTPGYRIPTIPSGDAGDRWPTPAEWQQRFPAFGIPGQRLTRPLPELRRRHQVWGIPSKGESRILLRVQGRHSDHAGIPSSRAGAGTRKGFAPSQWA